MRQYDELLTEAITLKALTNPFTRRAATSALRGAYRAVEELTKEVLVSGTKFIVRNPHYAIAGLMFLDYGVLKDGPMTNAAIKYFENTFPGHARSFYNGLAEITVDNKIQPEEVADAVVAISDHFTKQ